MSLFPFWMAHLLTMPCDSPFKGEAGYRYASEYKKAEAVIQIRVDQAVKVALDWSDLTYTVKVPPSKEKYRLLYEDTYFDIRGRCYVYHSDAKRSQCHGLQNS